ncbi:MAG: hypothetical protein HQL93_00320 [Magnetococcales bacterium]|nr:hypothetical protein [Magnetococcales bacterium]
MFGSEVIYRFNTVKLLDYLKRLPELEASDNPFAIVTLAHLRAKQTKNRMDERYQHRWYITRSLLKHGFTHQQITDLNKFIEWILSLPPKDENRFWKELSNCEESQKMPYITNAERARNEMSVQKGKVKCMVEEPRAARVAAGVCKMAESDLVAKTGKKECSRPGIYAGDG